MGLLLKRCASKQASQKTSQPGRRAGRQAGRQPGRQAARQPGSQAGRQADRQAARQTDTRRKRFLLIRPRPRSLSKDFKFRTGAKLPPTVHRGTQEL